MDNITAASKIDYITHHPETIEAAIVKHFAEKNYTVTVVYMPHRRLFAVYWQDEHVHVSVDDVASTPMIQIVEAAIYSWRLPFA